MDQEQILEKLDDHDNQQKTMPEVIQWRKKLDKKTTQKELMKTAMEFFGNPKPISLLDGNFTNKNIWKQNISKVVLIHSIVFVSFRNA